MSEKDVRAAGAAGGEKDVRAAGWAGAGSGAGDAPSVDLSGLNERQLKIATTLDEPLFVEAGAGSGKTFTLTQRVAWALSPGSGADGRPFLDGLDQVLVITFTEAAAREIKERVRATLRRAGMAEAALAVDDAWISTIHAMCRRILSRHALDLGLDPSFSVVADARQQALFDRAMDDVMRAARRVGRAVCTVRADRKHQCILHARNAARRGERKLLVAAALALAGDMHHGLTACDKGQRPVGIRVILRDRSEETARLARLTAQACGQNLGLIAQRGAFRRSRGA